MIVYIPQRPVAVDRIGLTKMAREKSILGWVMKSGVIDVVLHAKGVV